MTKLSPYKRESPFGYALGPYPCHVLLERRPEAARRLLLRPDGVGGEGVEALRAKCASLGVREEFAANALRRESRKENCLVGLAFEKYRDELCDEAPHAVLWRVSDFGNLGSSVRACLGFGIRDVALIAPAADPFDPQAIRASMGAMFGARVEAFADFAAYRSRHPEHRIYPFMLGGALTPEAAGRDAPSRYALVFGNEGAGLPEEFASLGTGVRIPISDEIDSLNLACAVAIGAYAFSARGRGLSIGGS